MLILGGSSGMALKSRTKKDSGISLILIYCSSLSLLPNAFSLGSF